MSETAQNEDPPVLELTEKNLKRLNQSQISAYRPTTGQAATCSASFISDGDTCDPGDRQAGRGTRTEDATQLRQKTTKTPEAGSYPHEM